jgi:phage terminase large subunit-like protein
LRRSARVGAQLPRVRSVPAYSTSAGPEAINLSARAGLHLDTWQSTVLTDALGEDASGRWTAFEVCLFVPRQNGKGGLIEARVLAGLFLFGERTILWSAHEFKTAEEGFLRIKQLIEETPAFHRRVKRYWHGNGEKGIELKNGARLKFVARSGRSGRGFSGDLIILDEAQELTASQIKAIFSTMSTRPNPQVWYTGTPPEDPRAWIYGVKADGERGKARLAYFDWGLELDLTDQDVLTRMKDRDLWYQANPALGIRISEQFCEDELDRLKIGFAAERLGVWLPPAEEVRLWQVISEPAWSSVLDVSSAPLDPVAFALDVTPDRDFGAIGLGARREDSLRHVEVVDERPGVGWMVARAKELNGRWSPSTFAVDGGGPAGSLVEPLQKAGLPVTVMGTSDVAAAYAGFYDAVRDRRLRQRGQKELQDAVAGAVTRTIGDGMKAWGRRSSEVRISSLVAATNGLWALEHADVWLDGSLMA